MINYSIRVRLKESLQRERFFEESNTEDHILNSILKRFKDVDIYYISSSNAKNSVKFFDKTAVIVWDIQYWDIYKKYVQHAENCRRKNKDATPEIIITMAEYLGGKYSFCGPLSHFLKQIPKRFTIDEDHSATNDAHIELYVQIGKVFSLFHELAHIGTRDGNSEMILSCQELVLDMVGKLKKDDFNGLGYWAEFASISAEKLCMNASEDVIEEVVADVFAMIQTVRYFSSSYSVDKLLLADCCVIAVEYLSTFQNMFNAISHAWDCHYAEIAFGLPVREHEIDTYINELSISRYGLGALILVVIVHSMLKLDTDQRKALWEKRDLYHVNIQSIVDCLADNDFICTAIEEAFK